MKKIFKMIIFSVIIFNSLNTQAQKKENLTIYCKYSEILDINQHKEIRENDSLVIKLKDLDHFSTQKSKAKFNIQYINPDTIFTINYPNFYIQDLETQLSIWGYGDEEDNIYIIINFTYNQVIVYKGDWMVVYIIKNYEFDY